MNLDPAPGTEISKTRPAVVVSNDSCNSYGGRIVVIPLTSNVETFYPGEVVVTVKGQRARALGDQMRSVDRSRVRGEAGRRDLLAVRSEAHLDDGPDLPPTARGPDGLGARHGELEVLGYGTGHDQQGGARVEPWRSTGQAGLSPSIPMPLDLKDDWPLPRSWRQPGGITVSEGRR
jgi:mRNA interferase MazF